MRSVACGVARAINTPTPDQRYGRLCGQNGQYTLFCFPFCVPMIFDRALCFVQLAIGCVVMSVYDLPSAVRNAILVVQASL